MQPKIKSRSTEDCDLWDYFLKVLCSPYLPSSWSPTLWICYWPRWKIFAKIGIEIIRQKPNKIVYINDKGALISCLRRSDEAVPSLHGSGSDVIVDTTAVKDKIAVLREATLQYDSITLPRTTQIDEVSKKSISVGTSVTNKKVYDSQKAKRSFWIELKLM